MDFLGSGPCWRWISGARRQSSGRSILEVGSYPGKYQGGPPVIGGARFNQKSALKPAYRFPIQRISKPEKTVQKRVRASVNRRLLGSFLFRSAGLTKVSTEAPASGSHSVDLAWVKKGQLPDKPSVVKCAPSVSGAILRIAHCLKLFKLLTQC